MRSWMSERESRGWESCGEISTAARAWREAERSEAASARDLRWATTVSVDLRSALSCDSRASR